MKTLLVIPGMPRSGTTSIVNLLKGSQDVFESPVKEPHFFLPETVKKTAFFWSGIEKKSVSDLGFLLTDDKFDENYDSFKADKIYIDGSTLYSVHHGVISNIKKWMEQHSDITVKFILCERDPIERGFSHYKFNRQRDEEPRAFKEALEQEGKGENEDWILGGYCKGSSSKYIKNEIKNSFGNESLLIIDFKELKENQDKVKTKIENFLNLKIDSEIKQDNKSSAYKNHYFKKMRVFAKKLRAKNPILFESKIFRVSLNIFEKLSTSESREKISDSDAKYFNELYKNYE